MRKICIPTADELRLPGYFYLPVKFGFLGLHYLSQATGCRHVRCKNWNWHSVCPPLFSRTSSIVVDTSDALNTFPNPCTQPQEGVYGDTSLFIQTIFKNYPGPIQEKGMLHNEALSLKWLTCPTLQLQLADC